MSATGFTALFIMLKVWSNPAFMIFPTCMINSTIIVELMHGRVMLQIRRIRPAPSTMAASCSDGSMPAIAAI